MRITLKPVVAGGGAEWFTLRFASRLCAAAFSLSLGRSSFQRFFSFSFLFSSLSASQDSEEMYTRARTHNTHIHVQTSRLTTLSKHRKRTISWRLNKTFRRNTKHSPRPTPVYCDDHAWRSCRGRVGETGANGGEQVSEKETKQCVMHKDNRLAIAQDRRAFAASDPQRRVNKLNIPRVDTTVSQPV